MNAPFQAARFLILLVFVGFVSACAVPKNSGSSGEVVDPYEKTNRSIHQLNLGLDRALFRPASKGYVAIVPPPIVDSFSYFADNASEPSNMVNGILQGNPKRAGTALARFLLNSTIGFAGLADPATEFGLPADETDFGETLHIWGAPEGAYVELPAFGPSNQRDAVGLVVDFFTNPIGYSRSNRVANVTLVSKVVQQLGNRGRYSDTIDSILYESADSYAQSRIIYLQNRRFERAGAGGETYSDPYADGTDPYAEPGAAPDLYSDPYEDPYE